MKAKQQPQLYSPDREKRVAEALRENLRKRKAQQVKIDTKHENKNVS